LCSDEKKRRISRIIVTLTSLYYIAQERSDSIQNLATSPLHCVACAILNQYFSSAVQGEKCLTVFRQIY